MATRHTLGYLDRYDEFRGTYIHWDGSTARRTARKRLATEGYEAMVEWIEAGIAASGYSNITDVEPTPDRTIVRDFLKGYGEPTAEDMARAQEEFQAYQRKDRHITGGTYIDNYSLEYAHVVLPNEVVTLETHLFRTHAVRDAFDDCFEEACDEVMEDDSVREFYLVAQTVYRCGMAKAKRLEDEHQRREVVKRFDALIRE